MFAIHSFQQWQVIGFNKDNSQRQICAACSLPELIKEYVKQLTKTENSRLHREAMHSYKTIKVWNVDQGFTGLELPSITK